MDKKEADGQLLIDHPALPTADVLRGLHFDSSQIDILLIARSLSRQCRYLGHLRSGIEHYSVAQHCVLVSCIVPEKLALCGLLHDAEEAWTGDIISPMKKSLDIIAPDWRKIVLEPIERAIAQKFKIKHPHPAVIKHADLLIRGTEIRSVVDPDYMSRFPNDVAAPFYDDMDIVPMSSSQAYEAFMDRYRAITNGHI